MTIATSRRAVLAGAASLPALSLPVIAAINPDAELLALGRQFDVLVISSHDADVRNKPHQEAFTRALTRMSERSPAGGYSNDKWELAYHREMQGEPAPSHPTWEDISDRMEPVQRRISQLPAKTLDGLKVKARSAKYAARHMWGEDDEDADWDHLVTRSAIDAILAMT